MDGAKMKIAGIPIRDMMSASCRIRFFRFLRSLPEGYEWKVFDGKYDFDVLYVQKIAKDWVLDIVKKAKKKGIPVVFDRDDIRKDWGGPNHEAMIKTVDVVTTDTKARQKNFQEHTDKPVVVIPDCIDYIDNPKDRVVIEPGLSSVVTFGHKASVGKATEYMNTLPIMAKRYICSQKMPDIQGKFIPWELNTFIRKLRRFSLAVLVHDDTDIGNMKSNNRLIVCMSIGLPVITSDTVAYRETLKAVGYEWLVARDAETCRFAASQMLSTSLRQKISDAFINYAWYHYAPKISGSALAHVFELARGIK